MESRRIFFSENSNLCSSAWVTPKLTYAELPKFQECVRQVRHAGVKVNDSCGPHVHVDAANHNRQNLISILYSKEDILFIDLWIDSV